MKAERWAQVDRLLDEALALPPDERGNFLARLARDDEELRQEVASLLAAHERAAGAFLQAPALEVAARQLAEGQSTSLIGAELGPYQIHALLGVGGMGEVYLAQDARLKRRLALKLLPRQFVADTARVERFAREARAVSALNHPNIVTVYDIGEASTEVGERHYIAMEYVEGQTLREKCRAGPSGAKEAVEIVMQIAAALSAAHEAGIVHRDIKPENIMLRRDGYVKVLDFGLAKLTEQPRLTGETHASASDRSGGMRLWRVAIDERSGQTLGAPELVPTPSAYSQHISFSRDGKRLAFAQTTTRYAIERRAFDPARGQVTGQPLPLVQNTKGADDPHLSPDGALLVYSSAEGNREELYALKSDGTGQPQQLTSDPSKKRAPRWSPNGGRIAFYCDRNGAWEIWTINADGTGLQQLTFTGGSAAFYPLWSPEGTRLIYTTRRATPTLIEVTKPWSQQMPQAVLPLADTPQFFWPRDWSPDGKKLAGGWREATSKTRYLASFDLTTRRLERLLGSDCEQVDWLNDSRRLIFQHEGHTMLLDTQTRKTYEVFYNPPHKAFNYTLSRDNRWLYYSLQTADADIWLLSRE